jgi:act minimal PKS chain-length factor (CLF/KS beta)
VAEVVVTGIGIVAPTGVGTNEYWERTLAGGHGLRPLFTKQRRYRSTLAGLISGFESSRWITSRLMVQTDISTRYALAAAQLAVDDCGALHGLSDFDQGVVTSNATGGFEFTHREFAKLWQEGPAAVSVYESFAWFYAVNTGQISIRHGMRGPGTVIVSEQAGGIDALGSARRLIQSGTKLILSGGVDSSFDPWGWVSHMASGRLSASSQPEDAYLPFDRRANGYVPGEGGAILALEDETAAIARSAAHRYGRIAGQASTFDSFDSQGGPGGLARAIRLALADASLTPSDVDAVFADAAGVPDLDASEAEALASVFGPRQPPVTAPKSGTGRLYAGGGPLDAATALLSLRDQVLPPTPFTTETRPEYALDLVTGQARPCPLDVIVVAARGRLGFNSALVLTSAA